MDYSQIKILFVFTLIFSLFLVYLDASLPKKGFWRVVNFLAATGACALYSKTIIKMGSLSNFYLALIVAFSVIIVLILSQKKMGGEHVGRILLVVVMLHVSMHIADSMVIDQIVSDKQLRVEMLASEFTDVFHKTYSERMKKSFKSYLGDVNDDSLRLLELRLMLESSSEKEIDEATAELLLIPKFSGETKYFQDILHFNQDNTNNEYLLRIKLSAVEELKKIVEYRIELPSEYRSGFIVCTFNRAIYLFIFVMIWGLWIPLAIRGIFCRHGGIDKIRIEESN